MIATRNLTNNLTVYTTWLNQWKDNTLALIQSNDARCTLSGFIYRKSAHAFLEDTMKKASNGEAIIPLAQIDKYIYLPQMDKAKYQRLKAVIKAGITQQDRAIAGMRFSERDLLKDRTQKSLKTKFQFVSRQDNIFYLSKLSLLDEINEALASNLQAQEPAFLIESIWLGNKPCLLVSRKDGDKHE